MYVFVYGTLKLGYLNNYLLVDSKGKFIKNSILTSDLGFSMIDVGFYPILLSESEEPTKIYGEVWEVEHLDYLDNLEHYPDYYNRKKIKVDGYSCWVYFMEFGEIKGQNKYPSIEEF